MNDKIWCVMCQCWVKRSELKYWSGDDCRHYLCPGCDSDLLPPVNIDLEYDRWLEEEKNKTK